MKKPPHKLLRFKHDIKTENLKVYALFSKKDEPAILFLLCQSKNEGQDFIMHWLKKVQMLDVRIQDFAETHFEKNGITLEEQFESFIEVGTDIQKFEILYEFTQLEDFQIFGDTDDFHDDLLEQIIFCPCCKKFQ